MYIGLTEDMLTKNYETYCDPRLNYAQSIETAFKVATEPPTVAEVLKLPSSYYLLDQAGQQRVIAERLRDPGIQSELLRHGHVQASCLMRTSFMESKGPATS